MSTHAAHRRLHSLASRVTRPGAVRSVARNAGFNIVSLAASGLGGVVIARAFGPAVRGEYAAITAWFGVSLMFGGMGQPAALCFYVARDPERAPQYVATSRAMMVATGTIVLVSGVLLAPVLARGNPVVADGYRIAFGASILAFVGASYTFSLQARDMSRWNYVRVSQPVFSLIAILLLWQLRFLSLKTALILLPASMLVQLCWAYRCGRRVKLVPGRTNIALIRPLVTYGVAQIAALTPAALNAQLDQLVLSQTVPAAELGHYAVAVSLTLLPGPLVSAIGSVAFPRLAAQRTVTKATIQMQRLAVIGSAFLSLGVVIPLAASAYWVVPFVFGSSYRGAVPLLWILSPGAVFLSCSQVVGNVLLGRNRPKVVAWGQGLAAVFTVVLLIALLPVIGVYGAAIASTVAYGVALAAMLRSLASLPDDQEESVDS